MGYSTKIGMEESIMNQFKRRDFVKSIGVLSACALTSDLGCDTKQEQTQNAGSPKNKAARPDVQDSVPRLNVILHGMFAVVLNSNESDATQKVSILAPDISDHVYYAAIPDVDTSVSPVEVVWKSVFRINPQSSLKVTATPGNYTPVMPATDRVLINWTRSKIRAAGHPPYCTITMPWPGDIWPMRADTGTTLTGSTYNDNGLALVQIPTVYVLTYALGATVPTFNISGAPQPMIQGSDGVFRLHLFAESATGGDMSNPDKAIVELGKMFYDQNGQPAVKFHFSGVSPNSVDIPMSTGHSSFVPCEERSTGELGVGCAQIVGATSVGARSGGHPRNCMAILITEP
jgi:hypothetical protein